MGYESVRMVPARIYTMAYAIFSSLGTPFVGFFASGFKRAVGVKDFADTLAGHGGIMDRMDCISMMVYFNYFFSTQIILRDDLLKDQIYEEAAALEGLER